MAARSHVDSTVSERRLRPIYDYLDNGNNKKALQEAEKLMKKQKDHKDILCAKALKALSLIRLTRNEEALGVISEVHSEGPTDDATLQAMTICYRELHKPELIADAYEIATKKEPQNEELLSHLFMSFVRNGDYKKQQQTAMALYKLKPYNPYYFWAVMSIVMQATSADEKLAKSMLLPLAERMVVKFVKEDKIEADAELQLFLMILELQEKYEEALNVLEGPFKDNLTKYLDIIPKKRAELLTKLERWPEANAAYKELISASSDQWAYYVAYLRTLKHLVDSGWSPKDDGNRLDVDYTYEQAIDFLSSMIEQQSHAEKNRVVRGPFLANIELLHQLLERNDPLASRIGSAVDVLVLFYKKFGSKPSCFIDIAHVLTTLSLTEEECSLLIENLKALLFVELPDESLPHDVNQMQRHMFYVQLRHYIGQTNFYTQDEKLELAKELMNRHSHGLEFGSSLLPTEFQPCDNYCLLAAHTVIDVWRSSGDDKFIVSIMALLDQGLKGSPSNFQIKLLLLKLYNSIGAVGASYSLYESTDVKHIQIETLGYLITDELLAGAFFTTSNTILGNSIRFFVSNYKDTVDYLISCYKFGSFTKIPDIVSFREKLNNSVHYALITVERMIVDLLLETKSQQEMEKTISFLDIDPENDKTVDNLTDNRDVSLFRIWKLEDKVTIDERVAKSLEEKMVWLKIRNFIVRSIGAVFHMSKSLNQTNDTHHNEITNGEKRSMPDVLSDLLSSLKDTVENVDKENLIQSFFPLEAPGPTRLPLYLKGNYVELLLSLAELALNLYRLAESSADAEEKSCLKNIFDSKKSFQALEKRMEACLNSNQSLSKPTQFKTLLEDFTNSVETFSLGTVLFSLSHILVKPTRNSLMRKGKKKKEKTPQIAIEVFQQLDSLLSTMETAGSTLLLLLNQIDVMLVTSNIDKMTLNDNHLEGKQDIVERILKNIENSYQTSMKELKDILLAKLKHLQSLKW